jgi:hypothetical protein
MPIQDQKEQCYKSVVRFERLINPDDEDGGDPCFEFNINTDDPRRRF